VDKIQIDGNELCKKELRMARAGQAKEGEKYKLEFLRQLKESGMDHCPCQEACRHHGNCYECVQVHRGHRDHLPLCMWDMINEKLHGLALLTEGSYLDYAKKAEDGGGCAGCSGCAGEE
jgi:hypothetical protein